MSIFEKFKKMEVKKRKFDELALKLQLNPNYFADKKINKRFLVSNHSF
ncbi:MAG: hypothetical protein ACXABO_14640 [Promethearchaeota archaeon]|jgi:hypothetical protein